MRVNEALPRQLGKSRSARFLRAGRPPGECSLIEEQLNLEFPGAKLK